MADLDRLDKYLWSDESAEECMMLSDLDGFLHGVICSPVTIASGEWVPIALGCPADAVPSWVLDEVASRYGEILRDLLTRPPVVEPVFSQGSKPHAIAMGWCDGFMQAMAMRPNEWLRLSDSDQNSHVLTPILMHLLDDNGNSVLGIPRDDLDGVLDHAVEAIPNAVAGIFQFWRAVGDASRPNA